MNPFQGLGLDAAIAPDRANRAGSEPTAARNITFDLIDRAKAKPDTPALLLPDREMSYAELDTLVWQCAQCLHDQGVRPGDVVALSFMEDLGIVVTMLAVARLGATGYSIPRRSMPLQRAEMLARAKVTFLACDHPDPPKNNHTVIRVVVSELANAAGQIDVGIMDPEPLAPWNLTIGSGSTGRPKLMALTHARQNRREFNGPVMSLNSADRVCRLSHFDFFSTKIWLLRALKAGASIVVTSREPSDVSAFCKKHNISVLVATVFHAERILGALPPGNVRALPHLRALLVSSSLVSDDLRARIRDKLTDKLFVRYNAHEAGQITIVGPPDVFEIPGTVGKACPGVEIKIVDSDGTACPTGAVGFICVKTPALIGSYSDDAGATAKHFKDGWFITGDLGRMTPDGHLIHMGRGDRMMIKNGINIYPAEIEQALLSHPAVKDAVAMPLKHRMYGDIPICAVELRDGAMTTENELQAYAKKRLGPRSPALVTILERIPRNEQGKLERVRLEGLIAEKIDRTASRAPSKKIPMHQLHGSDLEAARAPDASNQVGSGSVAARNITFDLIDQAKANPDAPVLLLPERDMSYRELDRLAWQCAQHLHDHGVRPHDTVAFSMLEDLGIVVAMIAVARLGATVFSIPQSSTATQRDEMLSRVNPRFLLSDHANVAKGGAPTIRVDITELAQIRGHIDRSIMDVTPLAPWELVLGSGSSGQPKLLTVGHGQQNARELRHSILGLQPADRFCTLSHFDFKTPKTWLFRVIKAGASIAVFGRETDRVIALLKKRRISVLAVTVFHAESLLAALPPGARGALGSLRALLISGSLVSDDLRRRIRHALTENVFVRYSANEVGQITVAGPPDVFDVPGTVGKAGPGVEIEIVDADGKALPAGSVGQIRVKTPAIIDGYRDDKAGTEKHFRDGWFMTGDLGRMTEDGHLIHFGRGDLMMIMNGINIYPAEIEQALLSHPAVKDAVAMPLKHRVHGDIPLCAVELRGDAQATEGELLAYARERLGPRAPRQVTILESILRNELGKFDRALLDQRVAEAIRRAAPRKEQKAASDSAGLEQTPAGDARNITFDLIGHAKANPDAPALLLPEREMSYRELDTLTWRCAQHLHDHGVRAKDVIGLSFTEDLGIAVTMLAVARLGATVFSIPRSSTALQREEMFSRANVAFLACDHPSPIKSGPPAIRVEVSELTKRTGQIDMNIMDPDPRAPWVLTLGSGSTGRPKLVALSHAQQNARGYTSAARVNSEDRVCTLSHFDFLSPKLWLVRVLKAGASIAVFTTQKHDVLALCERHNISVLHATVFHVEQLLATLPGDAKGALCNLRRLFVSSTLVSDDLRRRIRENLTENLFVPYNATECGQIAMVGPPDVFDVAGTVGRAGPGVEVQIVDASGAPLSPRLAGFIRVKTPALIDGYLDDEAATAKHFRDGWFMTGDLGRMTADGHLIHLGRGDRMMIMNGMNIYPVEIEQALSSHPAVKDAVAMPLKHRVNGDIPVCAVELRGNAKATEGELLAYARKRLGPRSPAQVKILERIPRNEQGKLDRVRLDELIAGMIGQPASRAPATIGPTHQRQEPGGGAAGDQPGSGSAAARNITFDLIEHAKANPEAPALLLPEREMSYRELDTLTWRCAQHLHGHGVRPGDVVALAFPDDLEIVVTMLAVARLGATVFSVPRNSTPLQRSDALTTVNAAFIASDDPDLAERGVQPVRVDIAELEKSIIPVTADIMDVSPQAPWEIIAGSGSTGRPKLFAVSHAQQAGRDFTGPVFALRPGDRVCTMSHFEFDSPKGWLLRALNAGASISVFGRQTEDFGVLFRKQRISVLAATIFHAERLVEAWAKRGTARFPHLQALLVSSSFVSDDLRRRIRDTLTENLFVRYNTNETGQITIAGPPDVSDIPGTVGTPWPGVEIEIVDGDGKKLPPGATGLIRVRSPGVVQGYLDDETSTAEHFKDGWFLTGDLGRLTEDGHLIHFGRGDRMMILNGMNIYPAEIEQALLSHPAIKDAVAMPLKHAVHGDIPLCAVELRDGAKTTETELKAYARERLGPRCPRQVTILERIPRNELGKLDRVRLNELLETTGGLKQSSAAGSRPFRQSGTAFDFAFTCPADLDLSRADDWLSHNLGIDLAADTAGQAKTGRQRTPRRFLMRSLLLARELLQAAGAPIFEAPSILALKKHESGGDRWNASVQAPFVEQLPRNAYKIAFDGAIALCKRAALRPLNDENLQSLYATIESELMPALKRVIPSGGSTVPLLRVAHRLGIPYAHLGGAFYQLGWGAKSKRVNCSSSEADAAIGSMLASNKFLGAGLLRRAGLPAPIHKRVSSATEAVAAARAIGWPIVIKPVDRERGEGVTVDIADEDRLQEAFHTARKLSRSKRVLVERQVEGCCHRLFVAHGKLLYAVKRLPIGVRGDGSSSIAELVSSELKAQQRKPPWLRSKIRPLDEMAHAALLAAGFTPSSVPPAGVLAPLRRIESTEWGGIDEEVSASIHPENLAAALRAAELFGLRTAGIDMISPDLAKPWYETGAIINEVNFSPLLGGGEISRRHIAEFLRDLVEGEGRIPIEVFVGGNEAMKAAKARWKELTAQGKQCFLTGHAQTLGPAGRGLPLAQNGLHARTRALLMHGNVEWLIVCVQTDELLRTGLPFDRIDRLEEIDVELQEHSRKAFLAPEKIQMLTRMVRAAAGRDTQDEVM